MRVQPLWMFAAICAIGLAFAAGPLPAQNATQSITAPAIAPMTGPESNLPLPRYVSLKTAEANIRRGPSLSHRIDWVFQRRNMPMQVVAEYGHWRRVVDRDGVGGWIHFRLLSGNRTVLVEADLLALRSRATDDAAIVAQLESGVVASLGECRVDWCRLRAGGYRGWARKSTLWGVGADEIRN